MPCGKRKNDGRHDFRRGGNRLAGKAYFHNSIAVYLVETYAQTVRADDIAEDGVDLRQDALVRVFQRVDVRVRYAEQELFPAEETDAAYRECMVAR